MKSLSRLFYCTILYIIPSKIRAVLEHRRTQRVFRNSQYKLDQKTLSGLIVSLTTIPSRVHLLEYTLGSLLSQSVLPEKIVLNICSSSKNNLPESLRALKSNLLEINFTDDIGPHTKLVPTVIKYPTHSIVTCDDDIIYPYKWLQNLLRSKEEDPKSIHAYRAKEITFESQGSVQAYSQWRNLRSNCFGKSPHILPLGYAGVYYPPNSLHKECFNTSNIKSLCPKADDLWFKIMSSLQSTTSYKSKKDVRKLVYVQDSQNITLMSKNEMENGNDIQMKNLIAYYSNELNSIGFLS